MPRPRAIANFARIAALALLVGCSATLPPAGTLTRREQAQLERVERQLATSSRRIRDPELEALVLDLLREIAPGTEPPRVYLLDRPEPGIDLLGERVLRIRLGLLLALRDEAELGFVLAHELAHRELGHVDSRRRAGWDAEAAEQAADRYALEVLQRLRLRPEAGLVLLRRFASDAHQPGARTLIETRISALDVLVRRSPRYEGRRTDRLSPLLARHRARGG
jgi:predicted Zn-dependent protease